MKKKLSLFNINLAFLVDANYNIATGHVIRCLNLADFLRIHSDLKTIIFFTQYYPYSNELIRNAGFSIINIPVELNARIKFIKNKLLNLKINLLIIDIPELEEKLIQEIKTSNLNIIILDTSNEKLIPMSDIIINITPKLDITDKNDIKIYQGINYWILNLNLLKKDINYKISKHVNNIFISFGTTDSKGMTKQICLLLGDELKKYQIKLIIGPGFKDKEFFKEFCKTYRNFDYIENPKNIYDLMINSDIALSAGGGTLFELIYIGVPTIIIPNSKENLELGKLISIEDMTLLVDKFKSLDKLYIMKELSKLLDNQQLRKILHENCKKKFKSVGSEQINKIIMSYFKNLKQNH